MSNANAVHNNYPRYSAQNTTNQLLKSNQSCNKPVTSPSNLPPPSSGGYILYLEPAPRQDANREISAPYGPPYGVCTSTAQHNTNLDYERGGCRASPASLGPAAGRPELYCILLPSWVFWQWQKYSVRLNFPLGRSRRRTGEADIRIQVVRTYRTRTWCSVKLGQIA